MTRAEVDAARPLIVQAIHAHMPSAAVASGWASAVDPAGWVARVSGLFGYDDRPADLGLTALTAWLESRGVAAGPAFVAALRRDWIMTALAVETRRGPAVCFADPR